MAPNTTTMSETDNEKTVRTPDTVESKEPDYPKAFNLGMIVLALILSMFLVGIQISRFDSELGR